HAQATRTWVSGVGDDVNPCSRTAPCKTFAGAISKTAAGGEISVLDPGSFGAVTITKTITINGEGQLSATTASLVTGVTVNAAATDTIVLRALSINGVGNGLRGVRILNAKAVHIENCDITGFRGSPGRGVDINLSSGSSTQVFISESTIGNNLAAGIAVVPATGTPAVKVQITDSVLANNASGIFAGDGSVFTLADTTLSGNTTAGVDAAGNGVVNVDDSVISHNTRGITTANTSTVRLSRSAITNNPTAGFAITAGTVGSFGDNYFSGNGPNVGALSPLVKQ
ncbi:MAG TPA: right-handed parallel beta-helix repeat-containing protein, partial [Thermoanaerobaculia bacterium]|nr:right-handed parallel beta-helix repeat-containing protein [Thermoanaerobaculia bacterium]